MTRSSSTALPARKSRSGAASPASHQLAAADLLRRGFALHQQGDLDSARAIYQQILQRQPRHLNALHLLGTLELQTGNPAPAVECFDMALAIKSDHADIWSYRGIALDELNRADEALACHDKAIAIKPDSAQAHSSRGNTLRALGRLEEALAAYDKAITVQPDYADAHTNRSVTQKELGRPEEALASADSAIAIRPDSAEAFYNRGIALHALGRFEEALASYDRAIALRPAHAQSHLNRGNTLRELGRPENALFSYDRANALRPDYADAYWNKSLALLQGGAFMQGWELYEWRWKVQPTASWLRDFREPLWLGVQPLAGKTILLHAEQGLGDSIQFCRYASLASASGATVLLEVPKALSGLLQGAPGVHGVIERGQPLPPFDYHCPLLSLPLAFRTTVDTIPQAAPYLASDPDKRRAWSERLGARTLPRVGIVWSGNAMHANDRNRSLTLAELTAGLPAGIDYVSLQKEVRGTDAHTLRQSGIRHFGDALHDFTDTAALCDLMDVVVSVDTSVAHLAGALGRTTWVLLPCSPDWRWLLDRDDSPWYASARLFRQDASRQWRPVIEAVAQALLQVVAGNPPATTCLVPQ